MDNVIHDCRFFRLLRECSRKADLQILEQTLLHDFFLFVSIYYIISLTFLQPFYNGDVLSVKKANSTK